MTTRDCNNCEHGVAYNGELCNEKTAGGECIEGLRWTPINKEHKNKPQWNLLPIEVIEEVVKVLSYGTNKHGEYGWKFLSLAEVEKEYDAKSMRHYAEWKKGNIIDPETNLPHLIHQIADLIILRDRQIMEEKNNDNNNGR